MDWLWPIYEQYVKKNGPQAETDADVGRRFFSVLAESSATLYAMEPAGDSIRFKGLGKWALRSVPNLLADPNAFLADRFGGGKYKVNFHHRDSFVGTHNFRTFGEERWKRMPDVPVDELEPE